MSQVLEYCKRMSTGELTKAGDVDCKWLAIDIERKFKTDMLQVAEWSREMHDGTISEAEFMAKVVGWLNV